MSKTIHFLTLAALLVVVPILAISNQSLWIDEAHSALKASRADLKGWWDSMVADSGSDMQMPLYMIYLWAFAKIFGTTEIALRAANLPWLVLGISIWLVAFSRKDLRFGMAIAALTSPFVWYYLNEARPYAMQLGASFLVFGSLMRLFSQHPGQSRSEFWWSMVLAVGIIVLCGSSMLGVIWAGAGLFIAFAVGGKERVLGLLRGFPFLWLATLLALLTLGLYFVWTLKSGARASAAASTGIESVLFVFYELFGFAGIGPGRLEIRESGVRSFLIYIPALLIYAVSQAAIIVVAWKQREKVASTKVFFWSAAILTATTWFLFSIGYLTHFRVLARHFTPIAAAISFFIGAGLVFGSSSGGLSGKTVVGIFLGLSVASCIGLRFAARHQKDGYRDAATVAKAEISRGNIVWWNADKAGAEYYRVPISEKPIPENAWLLRNPSSDALLLQFPKVIIVSKPDLYDAQKALSKFLDNRKFTIRTNFPAFTVWEIDNKME